MGCEPEPFVRLAKHILSVCANSASCERLFSIFGNILTKLQNCMGVQTMNNIGELKLHIRDEHVRFQTKKWLKKIFHSHTAASVPPPLLPPANPSPAMNPFDNDSDSSDEIFDDLFRSR